MIQAGLADGSSGSSRVAVSAIITGRVLMAVIYQPMLRFYRRSPLWGLALPLIAAIYSVCTLLSAWQYHRGQGGLWKGRVQAAAS